MRDLNYQLKQLCRRNRDGGHVTRYNRERMLTLFANQLHEMGFHHMVARSLKPKHVEALVKRWQYDGVSVGTIKNRLSVLRWWAEKVDKRNVMARSNDHYGVGRRRYVGGESRALELDVESLDRIGDAHVRLSVELQRAFGLRREEAIKFRPVLADRGDRICLKASWTKGGKAREVPVRTAAQRELLDRVHALVKRGALIPPQRNYREQRLVYERETAKAGYRKLHRLRHAYAQARYEELTGWKAPVAGGPSSKSLSEGQRAALLSERVASVSDGDAILEGAAPGLGERDHRERAQAHVSALALDGNSLHPLLAAARCDAQIKGRIGSMKPGY